MRSAESKAAIAGVDELLAVAGMKPGRRATLKGSWVAGERIPRKVREKKAANAKHSAAQGAAKSKTVKLDIVRSPLLERAGFAHGFSTRTGGGSTVYASESSGELNLSWTKEDYAANVAENRRRLITAVAPSSVLVTLRQVHSPAMHVIRKSPSGYTSAGRLYKSLATKDGRAVLRGDGMMTDVPDLLLGIQTADCIPVLLADTKTGAVAAFHAGWRGTLARIVERGVGRMRVEFGSKPKDLIAAIGPGIGPCCYAVSEELRYEFESQFAYWKELFSDVYDEDPVKTKYPLLFLTARAPGHSPIGPQLHLDLWEANRRQLLDAGLSAKKITVAAQCTACSEQRFFSHRAQQGFTGRMMNVIAVRS